MMTQFVRPLMGTLLAAVLAVGNFVPGLCARRGSAPPSTAGEQPFSDRLARQLQVQLHAGSEVPSKSHCSVSLPEPGTTNTPELEQMIHDGNLELSLQDAVEYALSPTTWTSSWPAIIPGLPTPTFSRPIQWNGTQYAAPRSPFLLRIFRFFPLILLSPAPKVWLNQILVPVNNPFLSGTPHRASARSRRTRRNTISGSRGICVCRHNCEVRGLGQHPQFTSSAFNLFNPAVQSSLYITFSSNCSTASVSSPTAESPTIAKSLTWPSLHSHHHRHQHHHCLLGIG